MSMMERIIYWIAIIVLVAGIVGLKVQISHLEQQTQTVQTQSSEE